MSFPRMRQLSVVYCFADSNVKVSCKVTLGTRFQIVNFTDYMITFSFWYSIFSYVINFM